MWHFGSAAKTKTQQQHTIPEHKYNNMDNKTELW